PVTVGQAIALHWDSPTGGHPCVGYSFVNRVYFGTDPNPPFVATTGFTYFNTPPLLFDTTYYWRVENTLLPAGTTAPSTVLHFRTGLPPVACAQTCALPNGCPVTCLSVGDDTFCSSETHLDHQNVRPCVSPTAATATASFDRVAGTVSVAAGGCLEGGTHADVQVADGFRMVGPMTPQPLDFPADLTCSSEAGATADLMEGNALVPTWISGALTLHVALHHSVGEEFLVTYGARVGS